MDNRDEKIKVSVRRPSGILYWLLVPFAKLLAILIFNIKVNKDRAVKKIKTPFIAIGTHSCAMDVAFMMTSLMPTRLNIVCGRDVFSWKWVKPIFEMAGLIPISQFSMDISSIRLMKKAIDKGCSLAVFPEGKISIDGRQLHYLSPSLGKLLKLLNVPVVMVHNNGGYSSRPRWYKKFKRGTVNQDVKLLFTVEELKTLELKEINERLKTAFKFNEHLYQKENKLRFKSKYPAKGLHYLLYKCPKCGKEYEMESKGSNLICKACGNNAEYTEYGEIRPANDEAVVYSRIDLWYDYEKEAVRKELEAADFKIEKSVDWYFQNPITHIYEKKGEGVLYIDKLDICFIGTDLAGKEIIIKRPLKTLFTIVQKLEEGVDLTVDNIVHRFYFKEKKYSAKYNLIVEESFRKISGLD